MKTQKDVRSAEEALRLSAIFNLAEKIRKEKKYMPWTEAIEEALISHNAEAQPEIDWKAIADEHAITLAKMTREKYPFIHIRMDASEAEKESAIRDKLIELGWTPPQPKPPEYPDDIAVDKFAAAMKAKMAKQRAKGYVGWDDKDSCPTERLQQMLVDHLAKGDPVDIGNFAMMLWNREEATQAPQRKQFIPHLVTIKH